MSILYDFAKKVIGDTKAPQGEVFRDWSAEVQEIAASNSWDDAPAGGVSVELKAATKDSSSTKRAEIVPAPTQTHAAQKKPTGGGGCCGSRPKS